MKMFLLSEKMWAVISLITVFTIDIIAPLGIAVDVLYICCILIVFRQDKRAILLVGSAASLLILINLIVFDTLSNINDITLTNHCISGIAVLITTYIAIHYQKVNEKNITKEKQYIAELEEMLFIASHKIRRPVANILGLTQVDDPAVLMMSPEELIALFAYMRLSAGEADDFIKELNRYIESVNSNVKFKGIPLHIKNKA